MIDEQGSIEDRRISTHSGSYRGPTSCDYGLQLATSDINSSRLSSKMSDGDAETALEMTGTGNSELLAGSKPLAKLVSNDPLQEMNCAEVKRLVLVFNNGPGLIYPVVETDGLLKTAERVFRVLEHAGKDQSIHNCLVAAEELTSAETVTLKLVLANALALEARSINRLAQKHFDSIRDALGTSFWSLPSLRAIVNWVLVVGSTVEFSFGDLTG